MPPENVDVFLKYGSFGLVAFMVIAGVTAAWKWFPKFADKMVEKHTEALKDLAEKHESAVSALTVAFAAESKECREERKQLYAKFFGKKDD